MNPDTPSRSQQIDTAAYLGSRYGMTGPQVRRLQRLTHRHALGLDDGVRLVTLRAAIAQAAPERARVTFNGTAVLLDGVAVP